MKDQWSVIEQVVCLLKLFECITMSISSDQSTAADVTPLVSSLTMMLQQNMNVELLKILTERLQT